VDILVSEYRAVHPGLLRYMTPDELNRAFSHLRHEFARPRTLAQAYLAFSGFAASSKCGHIHANLFDQTRASNRSVRIASRLPFYFRRIDRRMIVTQDVCESQVTSHPAKSPWLIGRTIV
jgi:O-methyltransferase involved in polyketide biosynthesis